MKETQGRPTAARSPADPRRSSALVTTVTSCAYWAMAWNVVIAGGGFAGATAARELEQLLPKQSARLSLVNDVNFMLYTPFLPEAAAGTAGAAPRRHAAARHPQAHLPAPRRGHRARPRAPGRSSCAATTARPRSSATTSCCSRSARSRARCRCPGLDQHAIGFKSLADAIWLRNHVIETLETANATEDPARRERAAHLRLRRRRLRRASRRSPSSRTSPPTRWTRYPRARLHGMRWILVEATDRVLPEIDPKLADYARRASCAAAGSTSASAPSSRRSTRRSRAALDRRERPDPHRRLDRRRRAASEPAQRSRVPLDERGRVPVDEHLARPRAGRRLGARRLRRGARPRPGGICAADRAARDPPGPGRRAQHRRRARRRRAARAVHLPSRRLVRQPRPLQGGRRARASSSSRGFPAWWMARSYHLSQIPGLARKLRAVVDWTVGLPVHAATPPRSARSATRARCATRLRARRHAPARREPRSCAEASS